MSEQIVDLRTALRSAGKRRLAIVGTCVLGVVAGALFALLQPQSFVARSQVILPPAPQRDAQGFPLRDIRTEVVVATSVQVLSRAGKALDPPVPAARLHDLITVRPVSTDVLEIQARTSTSRLSFQIANAVATEYADYANRVRSSEADATIQELQSQVSSLDERIQELQARASEVSATLASLPPGSAQAISTVTLLNTLRADQAEAEQLLNATNNRLGDTRLNAQISRRGTRVLDPAGPPQPSRLRPEMTAGIGGVTGLAAGFLLALALAQADRRLYRRQDIAAAVGADVLASLRTPRGPRFRFRSRYRAARRALRKWSPTAGETAALQQALAELGAAPGETSSRLIVVILPDDRAAQAVAIHLARFAASRGTRTELVLAGDAADDVRAALDDGARDLGDRLTVRAFEEAQIPAASRSALTVWVSVLEPGPFVAPAPVGTSAVALAVSAGFATAETLSATAGACFEAGHPVQGVFVADPDPSDGTTGRLAPVPPTSSSWSEARADGHTALGSRTRGSRRA